MKHKEKGDQRPETGDRKQETGDRRWALLFLNVIQPSIMGQKLLLKQQL